MLNFLEVLMGMLLELSDEIRMEYIREECGVRLGF